MADTRPLPNHDALTIACHLVFGRAERLASRPVGQNDLVRKVLIGLVAGVTAVVVAAAATDFGGAIYAEYRWARTVRAANQLTFDPWVGILGFPFATQVADGRFNEVEVRASGVAHPVVEKASLEATMHDVDCGSFFTDKEDRATAGNALSNNVGNRLAFPSAGRPLDNEMRTADRGLYRLKLTRIRIQNGK